MTKELKNRILENKVLTKDERIEIIKALEIVEEFKKAQIITGGRLNGRTYAYKCGLEDGKRKALEQQPVYIECNDIDVQKFTEDMKKQRLQVIKPNISEDCVSRQAVLDLMQLKMGGKELYKAVYDLPPVTYKYCLESIDKLIKIEQIVEEWNNDTEKDIESFDTMKRIKEVLENE